MHQTLIVSLNFTKTINWFFKSDWLITMLSQGQQRCGKGNMLHVVKAGSALTLTESAFFVLLFLLGLYHSWRTEQREQSLLSRGQISSLETASRLTAARCWAEFVFQRATQSGCLSGGRPQGNVLYVIDYNKDRHMSCWLITPKPSVITSPLWTSVAWKHRINPRSFISLPNVYVRSLLLPRGLIIQSQSFDLQLCPITAGYCGESPAPSSSSAHEASKWCGLGRRGQNAVRWHQASLQEMKSG